MLLRSFIGLCCALTLGGCAQYRQMGEVAANEFVADTKAVNDDALRGYTIGAGAMTIGALSRMQPGAQRCAVATIVGLPLADCTGVTAAEMAAIVNAQLTVRFGPSPADIIPAPVRVGGK